MNIGKDISPGDAIALQKELQRKIILSSLDKDITTIGGADISFNKYSDTIYAGIIVLSYPDLQPIEQVTVVGTTKFPYIPGLLAFREAPALQEAWNKLTIKPDVLVLDGHGIAHPRGIGIASHFGIMENTSTIGCGKTLLTGKYTEPENTRFAESPLEHKAEKIGTVLRTRKNCKPVFISPGHMISHQQSVEILKTCTGKYRIPEPTRLAHLLVNEIRRCSAL